MLETTYTAHPVAKNKANERRLAWPVARIHVEALSLDDASDRVHGTSPSLEHGE